MLKKLSQNFTTDVMQALGVGCREFNANNLMFKIEHDV